MNKILLTGNFEEDLQDLILLLSKLEEDFGVIDFIKERPFIFKEHPESSKRAITISMQELYDKVYFENKMLIKQGFQNMSFSQKTDLIEKTKKILYATNTALGKAKEENVSKGLSLKSLGNFFKKNKPKGFEETELMSGVHIDATQMATDQLNKFLGNDSYDKENINDKNKQDNEEEELYFVDPIQEELKADLFDKIKSDIKNREKDGLDYNDL